MHPQPLLTISPPQGNEEKRRDFSAKKINLDLGIGCSASVNEGEEGVEKIKNEVVKQEKRESCFTSQQFYEFNKQIFIYSLIASGLPVPFHLFLPIWMSVSNSCAPDTYKKYPTFSGLSPRNSKYSSMMDSEPGRCRRTDGRKWRCCKNAIPDQKYCERHMHRGRMSSRKHVESSEKVSGVDKKTSAPDDRMHTISLVTSDINNKISDSVSDLNLSFSRASCGVQAFVECRSGKSHDSMSAVQTSIGACSLGNEFNKNVNSGTTNRSNHSEDKFDRFENANPRKANSSKLGVPKDNHGGLISPGFGSSPDTVLQCPADKVSLTLGGQNIVQTEQQRCRRTDGKKWQCSKNAVPNQKYCEAHMHRGAKRRVLNPESAQFAPTSKTRKPRMSRPKSVGPNILINLNSMPASPSHITGGDSTSSSSDATTITDENVSVWRAQSLI